MNNEKENKTLKLFKRLIGNTAATILTSFAFAATVSSISLFLSSLSNGIANGFSNVGNGSLWIGGLFALGIAIILGVAAFFTGKKESKKIDKEIDEITKVDEAKEIEGDNEINSQTN